MLVRRLKSRDESALGELYDNYSAAILGIVTKIVGGSEDANDILQEVFLQIWNKIDSYDSAKGRLFTWMLQIARNKSIDLRRTKEFKMRAEIQPEEKAVDIPEESHLGAVGEDKIGISEALKNLDEKYREVLSLVYFKGFTHAEAAEELSLPLGTIKSRVRIALRELKDRMK